MKNKILFTGTASGKESLTRFHSSFIIYSQSASLLVDCGDGISKALLTKNIDITLIDAVLISHLHADHFCGLPLLLTQMKMNKRERDLKIFVFHREMKNIIRFIEGTYLFIHRLPFKVELQPYEANKFETVAENFSFLSRPNTHLDKYRGENSTNDLSFYCGSFLFNTGGKQVHFTGDIGNKDDLNLFADHNPDILISEFAHIKASDILEYASGFRGEIILTHYDDGSEELFNSSTRPSGASSNPDIKFASDGSEFLL